MRKFNKSQKSNASFKINDEIVGYSNVRIIGDGIKSEVVPLLEAKRIGEEMGMDIILMNDKITPPIVKIASYDKMIYEMKKNAKKNKMQSNSLKEIQLSVNIASNDLNTKARKAKEFIEDGDKVKVVLTMKGRELSRRDENKRSIFEFITILEDVAVPESMPRDEGNKTIVILKRSNPMRSIVNVKTTQNAIFTRNETLVKYYEEVRKFNILSKDEENELFYIIRHGNPIEANKAKDKLINCNQRFVIAIAKRFASNNNILDLINEGNIGLMESIDTFDESKGFSFISWAVWYIRRAINLYSINNGSLIRKSNISKTYHIMSSATNKFLQMNCRQPTHDELLEMVQNDYGVTIKDACDMTETKVSSIDESFNLEDDDIQIPEVYVFNTLTASNNSYEENIECDYKNTMITSMLNQLPKREQLIIKMNFGIGYDKEYKVAEIADVLRLTTERVRQLRAIALNKLKEKAKIKINKV